VIQNKLFENKYNIPELLDNRSIDFRNICTKVRPWKTWSIGFMKTVGQPAQTFESISPEDLENFYYIDLTFHSNPGVDFGGGLQGQWAAVAQVPTSDSTAV
jgi:hypothetical protein